MQYVDSLRFVAAMLVVLQHVLEPRRGWAHNLIIPLAPGVAGVAIFFFISGYVIPMAAQRDFNVRRFFVRRFFRIYPLYVVAIGLAVLVAATGIMPRWRSMLDQSFGVWAANMLLIAEFVGLKPFLGVSWTLLVEFVWYALFAGALLIFGKRAADRLDSALPVMLLLMIALSLVLGTRIPLGRPIMIYAAVIGFQCFRYHAAEITKSHLARSVLVFAALAASAMVVAFGYFLHPNLTLAQALGPWVMSTALFLLWVLYAPVREARVLNGGLLPWLGAMSYSTYLLHPLAGALASEYLPVPIQVGASVLLTLILSWFGFRFVEQPAIALGRSLTRRTG